MYNYETEFSVRTLVIPFFLAISARIAHPSCGPWADKDRSLLEKETTKDPTNNCSLEAHQN